MNTLPLELLDHIISFLPDVHIVKSARVNKLWRILAIDHLRLYRKCTVYLRPNLRELPEVERGVTSDRLHYIRRVVIKFTENPRLPLRRQVYKEIVERPLKGSAGLEYFECNLLSIHYDDLDLNMIQSMILHHQRTLKKIVLRSSFDSPFENFFGFLNGGSGNAVYCSLKEIEVVGSKFQVGAVWNNLQPLVAPNLQSIKGRSILMAEGHYLTSILQCVREFVIPMVVPATLLSKVALAVDNLLNLSLIEFNCTNILPEAPVRILPNYHRMINHNALHLEEFVVCPCRFLEVLQQYMNIKFPRLVHIKYLVHMNGFMSNENTLLFRKYFCNDTIMPALKVLVFDMGMFVGIQDNTDDDQFGEQQLGSFLTVNITNFSDTSHKLTMLRSCVNRITDLIVEIRNFGLQECFYSSTCFVDCPNLEHLTLRVSSMGSHFEHHPFIIDAFLCGIHIEEVKMLTFEVRTNAIELEKYQYAPIRPGLQSSNLKTLYLGDHDGRILVRYLSEVTCRLVFSRCDTKIHVDLGALYYGGFDRILDYVNDEVPRNFFIGEDLFQSDFGLCSDEVPRKFLIGEDL